MDRRRIDHLLTELREELADAPGLDPAAREQLRRLSGQIDALAASAEADEPTPLDEIRDTALRFETEYPRMSQLLGQIADVLGKMGI